MITGSFYCDQNITSETITKATQKYFSMVDFYEKKSEQIALSSTSVSVKFQLKLTHQKNIGN